MRACAFAPSKPLNHDPTGRLEHALIHGAVPAQRRGAVGENFSVRNHLVVNDDRGSCHLATGGRPARMRDSHVTVAPSSVDAAGAEVDRQANHARDDARESHTRSTMRMPGSISPPRRPFLSGYRMYPHPVVLNAAATLALPKRSWRRVIRSPWNRFVHCVISVPRMPRSANKPKIVVAAPLEQPRQSVLAPAGSFSWTLGAISIPRYGDWMCRQIMRDLDAGADTLPFERGPGLNFGPWERPWVELPPVTFALSFVVFAACGIACSSAKPGVSNGKCGTANGAGASSAPTSGLCAASNASPVTGNGPWTWVCASPAGSTAATCSAPLSRRPRWVNGQCGTAE